MNIGLPGFRLYDHHLGAYMRRWIFHTPAGTLRLHNIRRPDKDPVLHDHPWSFASLILRGGYTETRPVPGGCPAWGPFQTSDYDAGSVNFCPADGVHRITEIRGSSGCWTLVVSARRSRSWGFWKERMMHDKRSGFTVSTPNGAEFVPWREWVANTEKDWTAEAYEARSRAVGVLE